MKTTITILALIFTATTAMADNGCVMVQIENSNAFYFADPACAADQAEASEKLDEEKDN